MNNLDYMQVHRFRNRAATFLAGIKQDDQTVYLTLAQAVGLREALEEVIDDLETESFMTSKFKTFSMKGETDV